ncbi:MAG: coenzyme F420-0:L-glutamate ligase, partial [Caldilineaceae bacterium]|nr:coenzyme F420-0:L-glutamate ligase [Caldilineaceae bacterium]
MQGMTIWALPGFPLVQPGDDLAGLIVERLAAAGEELLAGDVLVIAQKVVSKAEGRLVKLADVTVDAQAQEVAEITGKDPRVVQVILDDSDEILRAKPGLLIVQQKAGWIAAHGG